MRRIGVDGLVLVLKLAANLLSFPAYLLKWLLLHARQSFRSLPGRAPVLRVLLVVPLVNMVDHGTGLCHDDAGLERWLLLDSGYLPVRQGTLQDRLRELVMISVMAHKNLNFTAFVPCLIIHSRLVGRLLLVTRQLARGEHVRGRRLDLHAHWVILA